MKLSDVQRAQLDELLARLCEDDIADEQLEQLDELVLASEEAQQLYVETMDIHAGLHRTFANPEVDEESEFPDEFNRRATSPILGFLADSFQSVGHFCTSPTGLSLLLATATMSCLLLTLALIYPPDAEIARAQEELKQVPVVARLTQAVDCRWADASSAPAVGAKLRRDQVLKLDSGVVAISFRDGAKVHLQGPVVFRLIAEDRGFLTSGRLAAMVPGGAIGFSIDTDVVSIIDLGTEFAVEATKGGATEVACLQGKIELDRGKSWRKQTLFAGASARITPQGKVEKTPLPDLARFPMGLRSLPARDVINVDFAEQNKDFTFEGPAAFASGGNYWNAVSVKSGSGLSGLRTAFVSDLQAASQAATNVTIELKTGTGCLTKFNKTGHALEDDYAVVDNARVDDNGGEDNERIARFVIGSLKPGARYDLYLYGSAGKGAGPQTKIGKGAAEGTLFTIGGRTQSTSGLRQGETEFSLGKDYVVFRQITADARGEIRGEWTNNPEANAPVNTNPFGPFNGFQIVGEFPGIRRSEAK